MSWSAGCVSCMCGWQRGNEAVLLINCYGCLLPGHFFSVSETSLAAQGTPTGVDSMSTSCQSNLESLVLCPKSADTPRVKPQATCMITFACEMSSHIVIRVVRSLQEQAQNPVDIHTQMAVPLTNRCWRRSASNALRRFGSCPIVSNGW